MHPDLLPQFQKTTFYSPIRIAERFIPHSGVKYSKKKKKKLSRDASRAVDVSVNLVKQRI